MKHRLLRLTPAVAVALLTACGSSDRAPGSFTADEAQELNDAAAMLDVNSMTTSEAELTNATGNNDSDNGNGVGK